MRRIVLAAILSITAPTPSYAVYSDDQLLLQVRKAIIRNHLVQDPRCLDYIINRKITPRVDEVQVLDHTGKTADGHFCHGDPDMSVTLFSVAVDRVNNGMAANKDDPGEDFPIGYKMLK